MDELFVQNVAKRVVTLTDCPCQTQVERSKGLMAEAVRTPNSWVMDFYGQDGLRRWKTMPEGSTKDDASGALRQTSQEVQKRHVQAFRGDAKV